MNVKLLKGQSILEVIIAVSVIIIIAASSVVAVLGAFSSTRLAEEETKASLIAFEGMEAVQSIRNRDWNNLTNGVYGLEYSTGEWNFTANPDLDPSGKFTRSLTVEDARRNLSGDLVAGNGIVDEDTKQITVNVSWNFTPTRQNQVEYTSYITNWQVAVDPGTALSGPTSCAEYCQGSGYSSGICRNNSNHCAQNGETYVQGGNQFCTANPATNCCCQN